MIIKAIRSEKRIDFICQRINIAKIKKKEKIIVR
jgi:hypothetical protein